MRTEIGLKFINECGKIPHPMHTVGWVHETRLEPINSSSFEIRKDEKNFLLIVREYARVISEVQVTRYEEIAKFTWVRTVESVGFPYFHFFSSGGGLRLAEGTDAHREV